MEAQHDERREELLVEAEIARLNKRFDTEEN